MTIELSSYQKVVLSKKKLYGHICEALFLTTFNISLHNVKIYTIDCRDFSYVCINQSMCFHAINIQFIFQFQFSLDYINFEAINLVFLFTSSKLSYLCVFTKRGLSGYQAYLTDTC